MRLRPVGRLVVPRVHHVHCIDPSSALAVARGALNGQRNVTFHQAAVDDKPPSADSQDFGCALGVLHHIPDTARAIRSCVEMLKPGAPYLVFLYYAFYNRPLLFKLIWKISDIFRGEIC